MPYLQGQIVKIKRKLPTGEEKIHPFLILSCEAANSQENVRYYTGVMMTGSSYQDAFSFKVEDNMVERPLQKDCCHLRLYIIASFSDNEVTELVSVIKTPFLKIVLKQIQQYVLVSDK